MFYCGLMKVEKLKKCNVSNAGIAQVRFPSAKKVQCVSNRARTRTTIVHDIFPGTTQAALPRHQLPQFLHDRRQVHGAPPTQGPDPVGAPPPRRLRDARPKCTRPRGDQDQLSAADVRLEATRALSRQELPPGEFHRDLWDVFSSLVSNTVKKCLQRINCAVSEVKVETLFLLEIQQWSDNQLLLCDLWDIFGPRVLTTHAQAIITISVCCPDMILT